VGLLDTHTLFLALTGRICFLIPGSPAVQTLWRNYIARISMTNFDCPCASARPSEGFTVRSCLDVSHNTYERFEQITPESDPRVVSARTISNVLVLHPGWIFIVFS